MKKIQYFTIIISITSCAVIQKRNMKSIEGIYYYFYTEDLSKNVEMSILNLKTDSTFSYFNFWYINDKIVIPSDAGAILGKWNTVSDSEIVLTSNYYLQNDTACWAAKMVSSYKNIFAGTSLYTKNNNNLLCYRSDIDTHFCYKNYDKLKRKEKRFIRNVQAILLSSELSILTDIKTNNFKR